MKKTSTFSQNPDLFARKKNPSESPLAVRMRPQRLDEIVGQTHILGPGKLLRRTLESDRWSSMIFYGPPGTGKTTLAHVISVETNRPFVAINAVISNVAELRQILEKCRFRFEQEGIRSILFIDEIHRFNKAQQDVLMPYVEEGYAVLIGATTHNPAFALNSPLLSRSTIFELRTLSEEEIINILKRAVADKEKGLGKLNVEMSTQALRHLAVNASGDARRSLNALEIGAVTTPPDQNGVVHYDLAVAEESCQKRMVYHDADEDYHYDTISAFIKSMRGSDPDAAVYWLAKMLYAGEDPRFIVRRILILASEDIGNADPQALILASAGMQAIEFVGLPEAKLILSQLVIYMALAPKSNASYMAVSKATADVESGKLENVPEHLRDSHYKTAKTMGHGEGYIYPHAINEKSSRDEKNQLNEQRYVESFVRYYFPTEKGFEKNLSERLKLLLAQRPSKKIS